MDYQIDDIEYLVINKTNPKKNNNNSFEYEYLKNWLLFHKKPINKSQIDDLSLKIEFILNSKLNGWNYDRRNK